MDAFWKPIRANNWDVETYRKFPKNRTYNRQIWYKFKNRDQNTRPANHLVIIVFRQLMQIDTENERFKGYGVMYHYLSNKVYQILIFKTSDLDDLLCIINKCFSIDFSYKCHCTPVLFYKVISYKSH